MIEIVKAGIRKNLGNGGVEFFRGLRSKYRKWRRSLSPTVTADKLLAQLRESGVGEGDTVVVHSALGRLGNIEGGAVTVVETIKRLVGPNGTIVMPSYVGFERLNTAMKNGEIVDLRTAPGGQGAITEAFRKSPGVLRSSHPMSSCCAWGKHAQHIVTGHETDDRICHKNSPMAKVLELNGKILAMGVGMDPISFYHVAEDNWDEYPKKVYGEPFMTKYYDFSGNLVERPIRSYPPEVVKTRLEQDTNLWVRHKIAEIFDEKKQRRKFQVGNNQGWMIAARDFYNTTCEMARNGITIYTTEDEWKRHKKD